ncbi:sentrin-specific protease 1-like [Chelonus insularis]|uniref:sentrin-specific protease 1-like n=1 Tax=Chelonus insularis TaxID=460826 RepID=UPI001588BDA7|nr:sentrin-specific protease 1-like [Chelonus insularis]
MFKMFEIFKSLFGWIDGLSRKRRVSEVDSDSTNEFATPSKRHCRNHLNSMKNSRDIIEIEDDDDDDVQVYEEKMFNSKPNNRRPSCSIGVNRNTIHNNHNSSQFSRGSLDYSVIKPTHFYGKHLLNSKHDFFKQSTLSKTYQLQEKEQYGKLLRSFLPQRIQVIHSKTNNRRSQKPIEVIDIESDPSISSIKEPEVFSTPKYTTPSRYFTPMGKSWTKPAARRQSSVEEIIKIDGNDISNKTLAASAAVKDKTSPKVIPEIIVISPEEVTTNSLRDRLSTKTVLKKDYIPRVSEQYNERMKQKCQEAEELKKTMHILAKRNRMARQISLEQQLSQSMKLYDEIVIDDQFLDEPSLPELTDPMLAEVRNALNLRPPDEVLVESFGLRITRKDIHTLAGLNWLNDEVINFYMNLLIARGENEKYPSVYAMNTFFYPKLISGGHSSLKRWTRKVDIFAKDIIVVPVHLGMHWVMSIIDFRDKSIRYYDSMGGKNPKCLVALRKYLEDESLDKKKKSFDTSDWTLENMENIPQQMNGSDCGVFSCTFAEFICANRELTFSQDNMPYFRNKMVYEILNVKLL